MSRDYTNVTGYIYKITSPNGKVYIGQTINLSRRKSHYKSLDFKRQIKLWNSCEKHNWNPLDNFEIIEECICGENKSYLNEREIYWIAYYNSYNEGLNCNKGGLGNLGYKVSEETLEKMSKSKLGIKHPSWRNEQKSNYTKGRKHSEESKELMSLKKKQNMNDETKKLISEGLKNNSNALGNKGGSKKIRCTTNDTVYNSIKEAHEFLDVSISSIINVLKKRKENIKGLVFEYVE